VSVCTCVYCKMLYGAQDRSSMQAVHCVPCVVGHDVQRANAEARKCLTSGVWDCHEAVGVIHLAFEPSEVVHRTQVQLATH